MRCRVRRLCYAHSFWCRCLDILSRTSKPSSKSGLGVILHHYCTQCTLESLSGNPTMFHLNFYSCNCRLWTLQLPQHPLKGSRGHPLVADVSNYHDRSRRNKLDKFSCLPGSCSRIRENNPSKLWGNYCATVKHTRPATLNSAIYTSTVSGNWLYFINI